MPYQRLALLVINEWRLVERRLAMIDATSPEGELLCAEALALRDEYKHLVDEAAAHHRPMPGPFPDAAVPHRNGTSVIHHPQAEVSDERMGASLDSFWALIDSASLDGTS